MAETGAAVGLWTRSKLLVKNSYATSTAAAKVPQEGGADLKEFSIGKLSSYCHISKKIV